MDIGTISGDISLDYRGLTNHISMTFHQKHFERINSNMHVIVTWKLFSSLTRRFLERARKYKVDIATFKHSSKNAQTNILIMVESSKNVRSVEKLTISLISV